MSDDGVGRFCANCAFYAEHEGECRRHAPQPRFAAALSWDSATLIKADGNDDGFNMAAWPYVEKHDWCGDGEFIVALGEGAD